MAASVCERRPSKNMPPTTRAQAEFSMGKARGRLQSGGRGVGWEGRGQKNSGWRRDLRRSQVQPPAQSRVIYGVRLGCSGLYLVGSCKTPRMEGATTPLGFFVSNSATRPSSQGCEPCGESGLLAARGSQVG